MLTFKTLALASGVAVLAALPAAAQQPPLAYGAPISVAAAKKAMAAAEAEAAKNNWPVAITIIDSGGHLVAFSKMENTQHASIRISTGKATTALEFRRPTKALQDVISAGGGGLRLLSVPGAMLL